VETRSHWDLHTLARDAPSLNPKLLLLAKQTLSPLESGTSSLILKVARSVHKSPLAFITTPLKVLPRTCRAQGRDTTPLSRLRADRPWFHPWRCAMVGLGAPPCRLTMIGRLGLVLRSSWISL
jgi:hypothetical protein